MGDSKGRNQMANGIPAFIVGNLTEDPELKYTESGVAVVNFSVAHTERVFDRATNEWKDGDAFFARCSIWRYDAEHLAASARKGQRVVVQGTWKQRAYVDTKTQENRVSVEVQADEVAISLKYGTAVYTKASARPQGAPDYGVITPPPVVPQVSPVAAPAAPVAAPAAAPVAAPVLVPAAVAPGADVQF